jgi:hypothetical protein
MTCQAPCPFNPHIPKTLSVAENPTQLSIIEIENMYSSSVAERSLAIE